MPRVSCAKPCIHEDQTFIRFYQQTRRTIFYTWKVGAHGAAIEKVNAHQLCYFTKAGDQYRRDLAKIASPSQRKGLR